MARIEIRTFDGDLDTLRRLAYLSWNTEYPDSSWPDLYTSTIYQYYSSRLPDSRFLMAAYLEKELVAFLFTLPRKYRFQGRSLRGVIPCMLASHPKYSGALLPLIAESFQRNKLYGADFALFTFEGSHHAMNLAGPLLPTGRFVRLRRMFPLVHAVDFEKIRFHEKLAGWEIAAIRLMGAHRPLLPVEHEPLPGGGTARPYQTSDLPDIMALIDSIPDDHTLVRVYDPHSLDDRLCQAGIGGMVVFERAGKAIGFISFSTYDMVNQRGALPWAWMDQVCWPGLSGSEKQTLLAGTWELAMQKGCIGMMEWTKGETSPWPFFRARFIPYPRFLDLDAWVFTDDLSFTGTIKVFEQLV